MAYLRAKEGDADSIAPSLYPGRPRRKQSDGATPEPPARAARTTCATAARAAGRWRAEARWCCVAPPAKGEPVTPSKDPFLS